MFVDISKGMVKLHQENLNTCTDPKNVAPLFDVGELVDVAQRARQVDPNPEYGRARITNRR